MAKGRKTGGKDFLPGNPGGPGRRPMPPEMKAIVNYDRDHVRKYISKYMSMRVAEIQAVIQAKEVPAIELAIATITAKAIVKADIQAFEWLMTRMIGKAPVEINAHVNHAEQLKNLSTAELRVRLSAFLPSLMAADSKGAQGDGDK